MISHDRIIVAIDTSGSFCSVAVRSASGAISSLSSPGSGDHFEQLPRMLERVSREAGIQTSSINEVRVGVGPGSFTGLRIGMSFAKGLAWSLRVPLVGCSSLAGIAAAAIERGIPAERVCVVADARRDEVFAALYVKGSPVEERLSPQIVPCGELLSSPWNAGETVWVSPQRDFLPPGIAVVAEPDGAKGLLSLPIVSQGGFSLEEIAVLEPTYLRAVAAKTIEERRLGT